MLNEPFVVFHYPKKRILEKDLGTMINQKHWRASLNLSNRSYYDWLFVVVTCWFSLSTSWLCLLDISLFSYCTQCSKLLNIKDFGSFQNLSYLNHKLQLLHVISITIILCLTDIHTLLQNTNFSIEDVEFSFMLSTLCFLKLHYR